MSIQEHAPEVFGTNCQHSCAGTLTVGNLHWVSIVFFSTDRKPQKEKIQRLPMAIKKAFNSTACSADICDCAQMSTMPNVKMTTSKVVIVFFSSDKLKLNINKC
jgi:hypothetical protein